MHCILKGYVWSGYIVVLFAEFKPKEFLCLGGAEWMPRLGMSNCAGLKRSYQLRLSAELGNPAPQAQPAP